ncbi:MFS transporter [Cupriavidus taiwanensis]|uniref:MFS transporter n=1 Tax=Cupriavidus taiwanensis TaxID=164546 RepID=UPI000E2F8070|nr:MFS transporter [Cupriavidus taiwanensis]
MFDCESAFWLHQNRHGRNGAIEYVADINKYTKLFFPNERNDATSSSVNPSLCFARTIFDYNEHFIELSNIGEEDRSLEFLLSIVYLAVPLIPAAFLLMDIVAGEPFDLAFIFLAAIVGCAIIFGVYFWPIQITPNFFTNLRARYRFNRTTRTVYVLRPGRYGGDVILDWDRVQAHPNWCAPREMEPDEIHDKNARQRRQDNAGGEFRLRGLVLYWPPLDRDDPERKGEDVLWVGPKLAGENLWQYIRTFMEEGIDKIPAPNRHEWLRKGFHTPSQHIEETELGPSRVLDDIGGRGRNSAQTQITLMMTAIWAPLHCLAERLCKWPTFPEEWNSDCGQKRRENGIGPEEPLRWKAVRETGRKAQGGSVVV